MSASIVLVHGGEGLEGRKEGGVLLHLVIVELDLGLAPGGHILPVQLLTVLGDEPETGSNIELNTQQGRSVYLCRRSRLPLSSILSSRDLW